jgi:Fe2+ transport system protein FeoA
MSKIIKSESVDISQVQNLRRNIVKRCMEKTINAAKVLTISDKNLCKSTGYLECQDFNVKINDLIKYYESITAKTPLKNKNPLTKRKSTVLEGISTLETNKLNEFINGYFQIEEHERKKIRKNVEDENSAEKGSDDNDSDCYLEMNSCPELVLNRSFGLIDDNFSLPNHECLNLSIAEHFVFDDEMVHKKVEQLDNNPVSLKEEYTNWKITNKHKVYEDELFANREKLYVQHDDKGRINAYHVKLLLSTSEEDGEEGMDAEELKALNALSQHSNVFQEPIDFDNSEELNKVAYTNFVYPSKDLAEDLLRCTKCDLTPHYYQIVRKMFDCARLGDFASLSGMQKDFNAARSKRKAAEEERAKKKVKRAAAAKAARAPVPPPSPAPKKNYTCKRKTNNKSKETAKRKNLTKSSSDQKKLEVKVIIPFEELIKQDRETKVVEDKVLTVKEIEQTPIADKNELKDNQDVEVTNIKTSLLDEKTKLVSMGLLPSSLICVPLEKEVIHKPKLYRCNKCNSTFSNVKEKKDHNTKVHPKLENKEKKIYECQEEGCFKKLTTRNGLKYHKRTQHQVKPTL